MEKAKSLDKALLLGFMDYQKVFDFTIVEETRAHLCQLSANFQDRMKLSEYHDTTLRTHFLPGGRKYMYRK